MKKKLFENLDGNRFKLIKETKELSPKSIQVIQKWQSESGGDNRKVAVKLIDYVLSKRLGGLTSADLPDTSTFAGGIDAINDSLDQKDFTGALQQAIDTAKEMVEEEGGEGIFENEGQPTQHLINGQSNVVAAKRVNNILHSVSQGIFSDNSWEAITKIFNKLKEVGLDVEMTGAKYGGHADTQHGLPKWKEWGISIPFTNNKGRSMKLVGQITAHGAGSVEQPLDRYDITAYVSAVSA